MKTPTMSSHWSQGSKIITLNLLKIRAKPPGFVNYYSSTATVASASRFTSTSMSTCMYVGGPTSTSTSTSTLLYFDFYVYFF